MAKKRKDDETEITPAEAQELVERVVTAPEHEAVEIVPDEAPTFTLRADRPGHLRCLMAGYLELSLAEDVKAAAAAIRAFDLWMETH